MHAFSAFAHFCYVCTLEHGAHLSMIVTMQLVGT